MGGRAVHFTFSAEQEELRRVTRDFLSTASPEPEVRRLMATDRGFDSGVWRRMAGELGLQGMAIPERYGGAGAGLVELGVVLTEMGRVLLCGPFFATVALAATALLESGDEAACARWLPEIATGDLLATVALPAGGTPGATPRGTLEGTVSHVVDGHVADLILVPAGGTLWAVAGDADGLTRTLLPAVDATRKHAELRFTATPATRVGRPGDATTTISRVLDRAAVALAAEQVGVAERAMEMAVDYALLRVQFGRVIGSFQAIKHKLADVLIEVEAARSAAWYGLWAAGEHPADLPAVASIAQATCSEAAYLAARENVQVHGGIGCTWEHPAHLYLKRAMTARLWLGDPDHHRERLLTLAGY
jgi:alkylation response protein AidB-like acyl-CoA dehydrogenase